MSLYENDDMEIIGLNYKDNTQKAEIFLNELGNPYKFIISDLDGTVAIEWGAYGVPETFLINKKKIIKKIIGPINEDSFLEIKIEIFFNSVVKTSTIKYREGLLAACVYISLL